MRIQIDVDDIKKRAEKFNSRVRRKWKKYGGDSQNRTCDVISTCLAIEEYCNQIPNNKYIGKKEKRTILYMVYDTDDENDFIDDIYTIALMSMSRSRSR